MIGVVHTASYEEFEELKQLVKKAMDATGNVKDLDIVEIAALKGAVVGTTVGVMRLRNLSITADQIDEILEMMHEEIVKRNG